jgi:hypothetical protein
MTFKECLAAQREGTWLVAWGYLVKVQIIKAHITSQCIEVGPIDGENWLERPARLRLATAQDMLDLKFVP